MTAAEIMVGAAGVLGAISAIPLALQGREAAGLLSAMLAMCCFVAVAVLRMGAP